MHATSSPRSSAARAAEPIRLEEGERLATDAVDGPTIALAEALVRARAQEAGLAYELIAARADLAPIVVAARRGKPEPDVRTLRGWRRELVGAELLELLAGGRRLGVGSAGGCTSSSSYPRGADAYDGGWTTSKSAPCSRPSARSRSLSQCGLGAPETNQSEPLSATIRP